MVSLPFPDRDDAARQLAVALVRYRGPHPVVLAIPRGAVPMDRVVADALDGERDVVLVRKLGAPIDPEFAIGAVDEHGAVTLRERPGWAEDQLRTVAVAPLADGADARLRPQVTSGMPSR